MWFRQAKIYQLTTPLKFTAEKLRDRLEPFAFEPCRPSQPSSIGWVSPLDEDDAPLTRGLNGCFMVCLQIEEKLLPASVIMQALKDKVKQIEAGEARKIRKKEKQNLKEEIVYTLLPRAFTRLTKVYAYIDTRNQWLVINSIGPKKAETFLMHFKKAFGDGVAELDVVKPSSIVTEWLMRKNYPEVFSIEKACILQDEQQQNRLIRCQHQDLFASSIQTLIKEGCVAIQTAMCWHDRLNFVLADDFTLRGIQFADDDLSDIKDDIETKAERFDGDLILIAEMLTGLIKDLLNCFSKKAAQAQHLAMTG